MATEHPSSTSLGQKYAANIKGKTILITGTSPKSIAAQLAISLAPHEPKLIILAGRSAAKMEETAQEVKQAAPACPTRNLIVDFSDLKSVRSAAKDVNGYAEDIDVLVLSAGIMAPPYGKTADGFESQFGVNHIGPFLFANSIMGKMQAAAKKSSDGARVVVVSSEGHAVAGIGKDLDEIGFHDGETYNMWRGYGQSKTANCLFSVSLANKLAKHNIQSFPLHPGVIFETSLGTGKTQEDWVDFGKVRDAAAAKLSPERRKRSTNKLTTDPPGEFQGISLDQGAADMMIASFDPSIKAQSGSYLHGGKVDNEGREDHAADSKEAERLWGISEKCVGETFAY